MRKPGAKQSQKKTNCQVEGVMFIPYTPYSALKKELTKVEDMVNGNRLTGKIRFVERAGPRIRDIICSKTPWKQEWCQREGCAPCKHKPGSCRKLNITYQITCTECTKTGKEVHYFGETSRTWWDRASEHLTALRTRNSKYAILKQIHLRHVQIKICM